MKVQIEVPKGKRAEWKDGVLTLVDDAPSDIIERIKTFEDACKELGDDYDDVVLFRTLNNESSYLLPKDVIAYLKLRIITAALNGGWEPMHIEVDCRYSPWFYVTSSGVSYASVSYMSSNTVSDFGSRLAFKSQVLAKYAGQQFIDIWTDFLVK